MISALLSLLPVYAAAPARTTALSAAKTSSSSTRPVPLSLSFSLGAVAASIDSILLVPGTCKESVLTSLNSSTASQFCDTNRKASCLLLRKSNPHQGWQPLCGRRRRGRCGLTKVGRSAPPLSLPFSPHLHFSRARNLNPSMSSPIERAADSIPVPSQRARSCLQKRRVLGSIHSK